MAPALLVEFDKHAGRRPQRNIEVARVTALARHSGVVAIPTSLRMALADPTAIFTGGAGRHQLA